MSDRLQEIRDRIKADQKLLGMEGAEVLLRGLVEKREQARGSYFSVQDAAFLLSEIDSRDAAVEALVRELSVTQAAMYVGLPKGLIVQEDFKEHRLSISRGEASVSVYQGDHDYPIELYYAEDYGEESAEIDAEHALDLADCLRVAAAAVKQREARRV